LEGLSLKIIRNIIVTVHCLLAVSLITACQPTESITVDDIVGDWRMQTSVEVWGPWLFLDEDGTYTFANVPNPNENPIADEYSVKGRFELEGSTLTMFHDIDSDACPGGEDSYTIEITEDGKLQGTLLETDCPLPFPGPTYTFVRLSP
jgi:hypothetical protein